MSLFTRCLVVLVVIEVVCIMYYCICGGVW